MNKKEYILHIVPKLEMGGIGMMLLNYYKNIDKTKYCFDIVVHGAEIGTLEDEFIYLGSQIFHITPKKESYKKYKEELLNVLNSKNYYAIHAHQNLISFIPLRLAKKLNYRIRIAHAHEYINSPTVVQKIKRCIFSTLNQKYATHFLYCGEKSKKWVYGKNEIDNYKWIPNGIDIDHFLFSQVDRDFLRNQYHINENTIVLITISRLSEEKNIPYVLDIVKILKSKKINVKYFIIGDGPDRKKIQNFIVQNDIADCVELLGIIKEVSKFYSFADIYLLPSYFEAFPVGAIEAQANSCPSILSRNVPQEVSLNDNVIRLDIGYENIEKWVSSIINLSKTRTFGVNDLLYKYDIKYLAKELENWYDSLS